MREWCIDAKQGRRCVDGLCRGGGETLCGFDEYFYQQICPQELSEEEPFSVDEELDEAGQ